MFAREEPSQVLFDRTKALGKDGVVYWAVEARVRRLVCGRCLEVEEKESLAPAWLVEMMEDHGDVGCFAKERSSAKVGSRHERPGNRISHRP